MPIWRLRACTRCAERAPERTYASLSAPRVRNCAGFWRDPGPSGDISVLATVAEPFQGDGGTRLLAGNLGRACMKVSAVAEDRWTIEAPCRVFHDQQSVQAAFDAWLEGSTKVATRKASQNTLEAYGPVLGELLGLSAEEISRLREGKIL